MNNNWEETLSVFVAGVGVGALVGILFAPKSGLKTRRQIVKTVQDSYDTAVASGQELVDRASETIEELSERVADASEKAHQQLKSIVS